MAETGIARAETLGPDGGQRTWKPGPGGAEGPTDAKESAHDLFPDTRPAGDGDGPPARLGRARQRRGRSPVRLINATDFRRGWGAAPTIAHHGRLTDNKDPSLGGGQDNGELSDVAQKYGTTPGTASAVFPRLGYAMAYGANINSLPGPVNTKIEPKASTLSRQGEI